MLDEEVMKWVQRRLAVVSRADLIVPRRSYHSEISSTKETSRMEVSLEKNSKKVNN